MSIIKLIKKMFKSPKDSKIEPPTQEAEQKRCVAFVNGQLTNGHIDLEATEHGKLSQIDTSINLDSHE